MACADWVCGGGLDRGFDYGGVEMISFTVYGNPVAQGRPRAFKMGNKIGMYDPKNSREWKHIVKAQAALHRREETGLINGPIHLALEFYLLRPKSLPKKVKEHIKRPDLDNLAKAVKDALKGIFYRDDSQISLLLLSKTYCRDDTDPPRVVVSMESLDKQIS